MKRISHFTFRILLPILSGTFYISNAQDSIYTRNVIKTLCSKEMGGRGYVKDGDGLAATFIQAQFDKFHLGKFNNSFYQPFTFPVNTFPSKMLVKVEDKKLIPGVDYIVDAASGSGSGKFEIIRQDNLYEVLHENEYAGKVVLFDKSLFASPEDKKQLQHLIEKPKGAAGVILLEEKKLTWDVAPTSYNHFVLQILKKSFPDSSKKVFVNIKNEFINSHQSKNVIGFIEGRIKDTFLVFTAHFDHLGWMGRKTYFPGANDNASGTSMLLNLVKYYSELKIETKYSIAFIAFAGEEAGLVGSKYYTEHPLFPLAQIKFLVNMDLLGTGDEGMMVVNATEFENQYNALVKINDEKKYLPKIDKRGKAANSDHYFFTEAGVPAFFFYTLGGIKAYHDIYDQEYTLPLTRYREVFRLITDFVGTF